MKSSQILILSLFLLISFNCKAQQTQIEENLTSLSSNLIGTWKSEKDTNWRVEFSNTGQVYWYYTDEETEVFTYSISTTSPQCNEEVHTGGQEDFYLVLTGSGEKYCYEILGVNNETLSLKTIGNTNEYQLFLKI